MKHKLQEVIFYDLECLELKDTKDNKYHYKLLRRNLKDLFKEINTHKKKQRTKKLGRM